MTHRLNAFVVATLAALSVSSAVYFSRPAPISTNACGVVMKVYDPTLERFAPAWQKEIARRFPNAVGILLHGGELMEGHWTVKTSETYRTEAKEVVLENMRLYPGKVVVLLACNPAHLQLGVPGVYHATDSVWCIPDHALAPDALVDADTFDGPIPSEPLSFIPAGQPAGISPFPWIPGLSPAPEVGKQPKVVIVYKSPPVTRWETNPTVHGNIFEFTAE